MSTLEYRLAQKYNVGDRVIFNLDHSFTHERGPAYGVVVQTGLLNDRMEDVYKIAIPYPSGNFDYLNNGSNVHNGEMQFDACIKFLDPDDSCIADEDIRIGEML